MVHVIKEGTAEYFVCLFVDVSKFSAITTKKNSGRIPLSDLERDDLQREGSV